MIRRDKFATHRQKIFCEVSRARLRGHDIACIPPGPCLFYLYNPFREEILRRFITHVLISYANEPRALRFVYLNPVHKCAFAAQPELIEAALPPAFAAIFGIFSPYSVCVFETVTSNALDRN